METGCRRGPARTGRAWPAGTATARRLMAVSGRELTEAADRGLALARAHEAGIADTYGGSYFGEGRDASGDRAGRSGYARYDRIASNADIAGWLLWRNFRVSTATRRRLCHGVPGGGAARAGDRRRGLRRQSVRHRPCHARGRRPCAGGQPVRRPPVGGRRLRAGDRPRDPRAPAARPGGRSPWPSSAGCAAPTCTPPSRPSGPTCRGRTGTSRARSAPSGSTTTAGSAPTTRGRCPSPTWRWTPRVSWSRAT